MNRDEPLLFTKSIRLFSNLRYIYKKKEEQKYQQAEWVGSWVSHWYKDRLNEFFLAWGGGGGVLIIIFHFLYAVIKRKSDNHMGFFQEYLMAL